MRRRYDTGGVGLRACSFRRFWCRASPPRLVLAATAGKPARALALLLLRALAHAAPAPRADCRAVCLGGSVSVAPTSVQ